MLKKINLSEQAYDELVKRIVSGSYPEGETLQEEKLAAEFGISRTPVREALRKLEAEGLVEPLARGFRVTVLDEEALRELFECRACLENQALQTSIKKIPAEEIKGILHTLKTCLNKKNPRKTALDADLEMHALIRDWCGNRYLSALISRFHLKTAPYRNFRNAEKATPEELVNERIAILNAILAREESLASRLLHRHILRGIGKGQK